MNSIVLKIEILLAAAREAGDFRRARHCRRALRRLGVAA